MLTIQEILSSDSIATLVSKVNQNFRTISLAGGGPQGLYGPQGIPGLPGRKGATGPTGTQGIAGSSVDIIPFQTSPTPLGSTSGVSYPVTSKTWLTTFLDTSPTQGDVWIDHDNIGYWKYLTGPDSTGAYTAGSWGGSDWYFYPTDLSSAVASIGLVWANDNSSYLPYLPYGVDTGASGPVSTLNVNNARLITKYGSVWISSGDGASNTAGNYDSSPLYDWGSVMTNPPDLLPGGISRVNNGIDRLLFKMSIDGLPYLENVSARGLTAAGIVPTGGFFPGDVGTFISYQGKDFFNVPIYDVTLDNYTPLLFMGDKRMPRGSTSSRGDVPTSLGLYLYSDVDDASSEYPRGIALFSTRYQSEPPYSSTASNYFGSTNRGELVFDVRRLLTLNQYVNTVPTDTEFGSVSITGGYYVEDSGNSYSYAAFAGYHSLINGSQINQSSGNSGTNWDSWNYGNQNTGGYAMRTSWWGSSVLSSTAGFQSTGADPNLKRVSGMLERGHSLLDSSNSLRWYLNDLVFYTSNFTGNTSGLTGSNIPDANLNQQNSYPVLYISPFKNIGIGTFSDDFFGSQEPLTRFQVHSHEGINDEREILHTAAASSNPVINQKTGNKIYRNASFTIGRPSTSESNFLDVYLGTVSPNSNELVDPISSTSTPFTDYAGRPQASIRWNQWSSNIYWGTGAYWNNSPAGSTGNNSLSELGSLHFGLSQESNNYAGDSQDTFKRDFHLALSPLSIEQVLNPSGLTEIDVEREFGIGIKNNYPRTRFHLYGKNLYNEWKDEEAAYPGSTFAASFYTTGGVTGGVTGYVPNNISGNQISIDYIGDKFLYTPGILDYQYGAFNVSSYSPSTATFSFNNAVYPSRDSQRTTTTSRQSVTGHSGGSSERSTHGETGGLLFYEDKYIGFNVFRDIKVDGDNRLNTTWRTGITKQFIGGTPNSSGAGSTTAIYQNGGSGIITNSKGDFSIFTLPTERDGGDSYSQFEQRLIDERDIVNNIRLIVTPEGDVGVGNKPGYDNDAYPGLTKNRSGEIQYLPYNEDPRNGNPKTLSDFYTNTSFITGPGSSKWNFEKYRYGLLNYHWLSTSPSGTTNWGVSAFNSTTGPKSTALVNEMGTLGEHIRFEIGAEKAYTRPGFFIESRGYGYPASTSLVITGPNASPSGNGALNYIKTDDDLYAPANLIKYITIQTDSLGRIKNILLDGDETTFLTEWNSSNAKLVLPHPTEFNIGGPLASAAGVPVGYQAPNGAVAASVNSYATAATGAGYMRLQWHDSLANVSGFEERDLTRANLRLNNFVAGEGSDSMPSGANSDITGTLLETKNARQESPKLILTFLESDPTGYEYNYRQSGSGSISYDSTGPYFGQTTAHKKVSTSIQSAQNEVSLREYWIPKADNEGGTLMVFTDHFGNKEYESGFDRSLTGNTAVSERFVLDQLVALEYTTYLNYNGNTAGHWDSLSSGPQVIYNYYSTSAANSIETPSYFIAIQGRDYGVPFDTPFNEWGNGTASYPSGLTTSTGPFSFPGYVSYEILGTSPTDENTCGTSGARSSSEPVAIVDVNPGYFAYPISRKTSSAFEIVYRDTGPNWNSDSDIPSQYKENEKPTEFRFKRINTDFALVDFNITLKMKDVILSILNTSSSYTDCNSLYGGPSWVKYIRLRYDLDVNSAPDGGDFSMWHWLNYGNGMYLRNWSLYKNTYSGSAIVGPYENDLYNDFPNRDGASGSLYWPYDNYVSGATSYGEVMNLGNDGMPHWQTYQTASNVGHTLAGYYSNPTGSTGAGSFITYIPATWNGGLHPFLKDISGPMLSGDSNFVENTLRANLIPDKWADWFYGTVAKPTGVTGSNIRTEQKRKVLDKMDSLFGGKDAFSRNRNTKWRIMPHHNRPDSTSKSDSSISQTDQLVSIAGSDVGADNNPDFYYNSFFLEIFFDEPIMISPHDFPNPWFYGVSGNTSGAVEPVYDTLTVNGQAILEFNGKVSKIDVGA